MKTISTKRPRASILLIALCLSGCAGIHVEPKELAAMEASQVILTLAKERPSQVAWRDRVIDSIERIHTTNFVAHQTHYVSANVATDGKDYIAAKFVKSYCEAKGGIYPDKTFGAPNPHGLRTDCVSLSTGQLLFSVVTSTSSKFPLVMGGFANYNLVAIVVPKVTDVIDPATEYKMMPRDLPNNYFLNGTINMFALERK